MICSKDQREYLQKMVDANKNIEMDTVIGGPTKYKIPLNDDGSVDIEDIVNDCAYGCSDHSDYRGILQALVNHTRRETYLDKAKEVEG